MAWSDNVTLANCLTNGKQTSNMYLQMLRSDRRIIFFLTYPFPVIRFNVTPMKRPI